MIFDKRIGHSKACRRGFLLGLGLQTKPQRERRCSKRPLVLEALEGRLCPAFTLTSASIQAGYGISVFATDFPVDQGVGVTSIVFRQQGGELVSDGSGNVRLFPTDSDGQSAAYFTPSQVFAPGDATGLAQESGNIYMTQQSSEDVVQLNANGTFEKVIANNMLNASGIAVNPQNGDLFVSDAYSTIYDVNPKTDTATSFLHPVVDYGVAVSPDGKTLYAAGIYDNQVMGYNTQSGTSVFNSGPIADGPNGLALGTGRFAGHLYVSTLDGSLIDINLATNSQTVIASGGERGDFLAFDPNDGSLLVTQSDRIVRVKFPPGPATSFQIAAPSSILPGQPFVASITALDSDGYVATGYTGTVQFTSSDAYPALLPAEYTFTAGDNGVHEFAAVLFTAGTQTLAAQDAANASLAGNTTVAVHAAPATHLQITAPSTTVAGSSFTVTVAALDPYGNADPSYTGTVTFTSTDAASGVVLPASYTFVAADKGTHTFSGGVTLLTAQSTTITVTDKANANFTTSATLVVAPAPASRLLLSAPNTAVAGTAFPVTVTVFDPYGNVASNYTGTVSFRSTDPYPGMMPANYTFAAADQGTHTFNGGATLFTAGAQTLTVQDTANGALTASVPVTVSPATVSQFMIAAPASTAPGNPFSFTVTLFDAYGNLATNYTGTVTFMSSDPYPALLPAYYTFTSSDNGTHNFGAVFFTPGNQTLTVMDTATGATGSVTITVTSPPLPPGGGASGPGTPLTDGVGQTAQKVALLDRVFGSLDVKNPPLVFIRPEHKGRAQDPLTGDEWLEHFAVRWSKPLG
jgi:WD40 repeat protein